MSVSLYVLGNVLGRLLMSYAIVLLACLLASRFDWRGALTKSRRWYGVLAVVLVFVIGLAGTAGMSGGVA